MSPSCQLHAEYVCNNLLLPMQEKEEEEEEQEKEEEEEDMRWLRKAFSTCHQSSGSIQ